METRSWPENYSWRDDDALARVAAVCLDKRVDLRGVFEKPELVLKWI